MSTRQLLTIARQKCVTRATVAPVSSTAPSTPGSSASGSETVSSAAERPAAGTVVLRARGVGKAFFGHTVLAEVDLDLRAGEVTGLVGENGAGKSTLMKILAGVHHADTGTVEMGGQQVSFSHPVQAQQAGLSTVFQEFNLLPERSIAENVYLGREPRRRGLVDTARMHRDTEELLRGLGITGLRPGQRVRTLSVAEQQVVEIAKAVSYDARIISMDEPTAALAEHEVELLYAVVRRLTARGVAILYVSHRLAEIFTSATPSRCSRTAARSPPGPPPSSTRASWCG